MRRTYTVQPGDTLDRIARVTYGAGGFAGLISSANPHISGGLSAGMVLTLPLTSRVPGPLPPPIVAGQGEVSITLDGAPFRFWSSMTLTRSMDSADTFTLSAPFEHANNAFVQAFVPLAFEECLFYVNGEGIFSGNVVNTPPQYAADGAVVSAAGYARAGVLHDCTMPASAYPLEYDGLNLRDIATSMIAPFGMTPTFTDEPGPSFDRVAIRPHHRVFQFLTTLAQQRGLVIGNDVAGSPVFQKTTTEVPVQSFFEGVSPVLSIVGTFHPQQFYSHVTALTPATSGVEGSQFTVENSHLRGLLRPLVFTAEDTFGADAKAAAEAKAGRMFANALSYDVTVAGWNDERGNLWAPNTRVRMLAPSAMVYTETEFLVRRVTYERGPNKTVATLNLVLPGAFEGVVPKVLPWDS